MCPASFCNSVRFRRHRVEFYVGRKVEDQTVTWIERWDVVVKHYFILICSRGSSRLFYLCTVQMGNLSLLKKNLWTQVLT